MGPILPCLLLLLLVPIISTASTTNNAAVPVGLLGDLPSFVYYQYGRNFSDQWRMCIEDGSGKCPWLHSVGYQGPCQKGELFVYNRREALRTNVSLEPVCQPAPCPDDYSLVLPDRKCYDDQYIKHAICSREQEPMRNLFGETFCGCESYMATLLGGKKNECYGLFTQGPCTRGSLFVPVYDLVNFGQGQCLPSPCAKLLRGRKGMVEIRLDNGRTECFELGSQDLCENKHYIHVSYSGSVFPGMQILKCEGGIPASAFVFASSEKCVVNDEGQCVIPLKNKPVEPHPLYIEEY